MTAVLTLPVLLTSWPPSRAPRLAVPEARQPAGREAVLGAGPPLTPGRAGGAWANAVARRLWRHHSSPSPPAARRPTPAWPSAGRPRWPRGSWSWVPGGCRAGCPAQSTSI